jgi:hypothetical protein
MNLAKTRGHASKVRVWQRFLESMRTNVIKCSVNDMLLLATRDMLLEHAIRSAQK